jgi:hypothetical protein
VTVEVLIMDQNDNAPFFKQPLYTVTVAEDQYLKTPFVFITAEDPDESKTFLHPKKLASQASALAPPGI